MTLSLPSFDMLSLPLSFDIFKYCMCMCPAQFNNEMIQEIVVNDSSGIKYPTLMCAGKLSATSDGMVYVNSVQPEHINLEIS